MSQPLLNQLRTSAMVGTPQSAFSTEMMGFPSSNSAIGTLTGGGFNQNPGNVRLNNPCGAGTNGQQVGKSYPSDTDRRLQYNLAGGASAEGQYTNNTTSAGFPRDFYGKDMPGQPAGFTSNEQINVCNSNAHKEQWKGPSNVTQTGNVDVITNPPTMWTKSGQPIWPRTDLYNPEEPTTESKINCSGGISAFASRGNQGFGNYQPLHGNEETLSSGTRTLQAHQVNDYYGATPIQLPHQCSICEKKVYNLKDWDQHVKGKLHLQNRTLYTSEHSAAASAGVAQYAVGGTPSDGGLNPAGTNPMVCSGVTQDASSGTNVSFIPAAAMKTYPVSDAAFTSHQLESKPFSSRKSSTGRVVHICNLPEGSCTENDVINLGLPFGKVTNYILMRSTHQAFLEMAYVEAAHAMVQYYQLSPATINNEKLLIRMSKRYKELQLKKPGKDVESIIHDIASQKEREKVQEPEHYTPERARSRSPIRQSLSPHSHSPSFTSCSSAHSPQGAAFRGPDRGTNGMSPHRGSWDWPSHQRRGEDERERDAPWRNGGTVDDNRPNGRPADRRKSYQKHSGHLSLRSSDERGGCDGTRSSRDWHLRDSPKGFSFNSYRNMEDDFYTEHAYKSDKLLRSSHQRHEVKSRRRDAGDYHARSRHCEFEKSEELLGRPAEERRQSSPSRDRSRNTSRRHAAAEKHERENITEPANCLSKEKSDSPQWSQKPKEECHKDTEEKAENEDTDEECWYPKNMEELVTVDEVGGEDDSIIEPDLSELEEFASSPKESAAEGAKDKQDASLTASLEEKKTSEETSEQEKSSGDAGGQASTFTADKTDDQIPESNTEEEKLHPVDSECSTSNLGGFPSEEFMETHLENCNQPSEEPAEDHVGLSGENNTQEEKAAETIHNGVESKVCGLKTEIEAPSPSLEQDKAVSEHSIPLGVEFIVPKAGFYCKLCGLFYTSEDTAKATHCRSTVHYRNLQKYLSQLAEESLMGVFAEPSAAQ
ncbi:transcript variant X2 [Nothobranchius furzeri]|nr:RNA-binding protein 20 isoform X2 [Nothobranchius furzeri]KAF7223783.1 transcript variant X2 [Nothobranchius furzeri]